MKTPASKNAPLGSQLKRKIRITHPFHPRSGEEFELAQYRHSWGRQCVDCFDCEGEFVTLELGWTDALGEEDPYLVISGGRSYFRVAELLELLGMLGMMKLNGEGGDEG